MFIYKKSHNNHYHQRNVLGGFGTQPYMLDKFRRQHQQYQYNSNKANEIVCAFVCECKRSRACGKGREQRKNKKKRPAHPEYSAVGRENGETQRKSNHITLAEAWTHNVINTIILPLLLLSLSLFIKYTQHFTVQWHTKFHEVRTYIKIKYRWYPNKWAVFFGICTVHRSGNKTKYQKEEEKNRTRRKFYSVRKNDGRKFAKISLF